MNYDSVISLSVEDVLVIVTFFRVESAYCSVNLGRSMITAG